MKAFLVRVVSVPWKPVLASVHADSLEEATDKVVKAYEGERIEIGCVKATTPKTRLFGGDATTFPLGMETVLDLNEEVYAIE